MSPDPSPDERPAGASEDLVFRRGKLRKRDDPAVDLFRDALASLADIPHVKRILLELGRLYNPVTNGPILDLARRRRIVELLEGGATDEVRDLLDRYAGDYTRSGDRRQHERQENPKT